MLDFIEILGKLLKVRAPGGFEEPMVKAITKIASEFTDDISTDALGNLIVHKKGDGAHVMLTANMDSNGFIVLKLSDDGKAIVGELGESTTRELDGIAVDFLNGAHGVLCRDEADEEKGKPGKLYIDIGEDKDAGRVSLGDAAVFAGTLRAVGASRISAPSLCGRVGCAILLALLSALENTSYELSFVFAAQGSLSNRGVRTAAFALKPNYAINIGISESAKLGSGAAIRLFDKEILTSSELMQIMTKAAIKSNTPYTVDVSEKEKSAAGVISQTAGGIKTLCVCVPIKRRNAPCELAQLGDIGAVITLVGNMLSENMLI